MNHHRGTKNFKARLTEKQVKDIYLAKGKYTQKVLADRYNVSKSTIAHIWTGRSWPWLTVNLEKGLGYGS